MEFIKFKDSEYPIYQAKGFAAKFIFPFAKEFCKGEGYDIGCMNIEWSLPNSKPIDITLQEYDINNKLIDAYNLPSNNVDYIFSSHCLEHLTNWVDALNYWISNIKKGGVLFIYLPDYSQEYWRPYHNRKHIHSFTPTIIYDYFNNHDNILKFNVSGVDLNNSFAAYAIIK